MDKFLHREIFNIKDKNHFTKLCLQTFKHQAINVDIYAQYISELKININKINRVEVIPFIPIDFFKTHKIKSKRKQEETVFLSSGTGMVGRSKHYVTDLSLYEKNFNYCFNYFYGKPQDFVFLALLPSYLERDGSSLIYMAEKLIQQSKNPNSGFYLNEYDKLYLKLLELEKSNIKTILLGVSFALIDFFEKYNLQLKNTIIIETGGMKGRKTELVKEELHKILCDGSGVTKIHSEYGMTELLSQAYSKGENIFYCPPQMKILIRDVNDPFSYLENGKAGGINVIDLANINSCSFIETKDLGKKHDNGSFEVLGRFDNSDVRGCNLLVV